MKRGDQRAWVGFWGASACSVGVSDKYSAGAFLFLAIVFLLIDFASKE